jgi:glycosyltransferase involved in cell wall biosynthesis
MKILTLVESSGGGTGRHVLDLAQGLIARGVEVHMLYSTRRIDQLFSERLAKIRGLHHRPLDMRTAPHPSDFGFVRAARRYLKAHGPFDAIHGHSSKGGAIARLVAFGTNVPAFYTPHGLITMDPRLPVWKWLVYLAIELLLSLRTKGIIAVSPEEARAAKRLGFGQSRVVTIPNGVGEMDLAPRADARQTLNVSDDALVVGFVGRLVEQKAPDVLLTAFAIAVKSAPHARLAMVGAGPLEDDLRELAWKLGIADKIIWLGERDARTVLAGFDCFALSSRKEGLPYVILEAMAAGLPVVATSSAGVEILVDPKENGLVVPPDDAQAFGQALTDLATNPALLASYARAARIRAARFTIDAMVDATLDAYRAAGATSSTRPQVTACSVPASAAQFTPSPTR